MSKPNTNLSYWKNKDFDSSLYHKYLDAEKTSQYTTVSELSFQLKEAQGAPEVPEEVRNWVTALCSGKKTVKVGHMMFSCDEGISNLNLTYFMDLIKNNSVVQNYVHAGSVEEVQARMGKIIEITVQEIVKFIVSNFATAYYPGD